jgi:hypothetical protein
VVATGVCGDGRREVLGFAVGDCEDGAFWTQFLQLEARGLTASSWSSPTPPRVTRQGAAARSSAIKATAGTPASYWHVSDQRHNLSVFFDTNVPHQGRYQAVCHA